MCRSASEGYYVASFVGLVPVWEKWEKGKEEAMQENQRVSDMAVEVLTRQASGRAKRTGEPLEDALKAVLDTEAGRQLRELRDGPLRDESAQQWQEDLPRMKAEGRRRARRGEGREGQKK